VKNKGLWKIYTDGAVSKNGSEDAIGSWAFVIVDSAQDQVINSSSARVIDTTNQRCELLAAYEALRFWERKNKSFEDTILYSDSAYLVNCWKDEWYIKWQANGWRNSKREPVANQDLWEKLIPYFKDKNLVIAKVKGHSGANDYNDIVDKLAVETRLRESDDIMLG